MPSVDPMRTLPRAHAKRVPDCIRGRAPLGFLPQYASTTVVIDNLLQARLARVNRLDQSGASLRGASELDAGHVAATPRQRIRQPTFSRNGAGNGAPGAGKKPCSPERHGVNSA
jgi:hypothetical protein